MSIEAMKQALEALETCMYPQQKQMQAITALRQAIEQAEKQEPVAYINVEQRKLEWAKYTKWDTPTVVNLPKIPLYTTPPAAQQEPVDKVGSLYPDFWEWLPKAYRDGDIGDERKFTKYNMEVAFAAGAEAEAKRMWVGLTDEEIQALASWWPSYDQIPALKVLIKDVTNSLKEKNT